LRRVAQGGFASMASPSVGSRLVAVTSMASVSLQRELSERPETRESIRVFAKVALLFTASPTRIRWRLACSGFARGSPAR
jgi:hypothetical protein